MKGKLPAPLVSVVRVYNDGGVLIGTIDPTTRERRDLTGKVVKELVDPAKGQRPMVIGKGRVEPTARRTRQQRKTRIKPTGGD